MAPRAEIIDLNSVVLLQEILLLLQGKMIWTPLKLFCIYEKLDKGVLP